MEERKRKRETRATGFLRSDGSILGRTMKRGGECEKGGESGGRQIGRERGSERGAREIISLALSFL
ncbi:hypothetical protein IE53DRAFT_272171 [Violaceomyces palustris]|uniref:Uncharacterized protein n=1 Tax=Violaceomyces palustris TaxID=1673888 RepID=A0ACD0P3L4_9BASI|nr:hypothetical protein IE53DRAFT_272171 [Violaceomyces palustris]